MTGPVYRDDANDRTIHYPGSAFRAPRASHRTRAGAALGLLVWLTGVAAALCVNVLRQYPFVSAVTPLSNGPDGTLRSGAIVIPLVVGAWSPRIIVPIDFEQRYSASARKWVMAHEAVHIARWDTRVAAPTAGRACVFWFNPLMYWAISRLRIDQELACDAEILAHFRSSGRDYATALLDAQMADQISIASPIACHWHPAHPLEKRMMMLKNAGKYASATRRSCCNCSQRASVCGSVGRTTARHHRGIAHCSEYDLVCGS